MTDTQANFSQQFAQLLQNKRMIGPGLLFLASHRPLAFVAGQMLYALQPITDLFDDVALSHAAELLSSPDGPALLGQALTDAQDREQITAAEQLT